MKISQGRASRARLLILLRRLKGDHRREMRVRQEEVGFRLLRMMTGTRGRPRTRKKQGLIMGVPRPGKEGEAPRGNRMGCWASCQGRRAGRGARNRWRQGCWGRRGRELWLGVDKIYPQGTHGDPSGIDNGVQGVGAGGCMLNKKSRLRGCLSVCLSVCLQGSRLVFFALGIVFGKHA